METPKLRHYNLARQELTLWREPINQARLDRHVFCQLTNRAYHEVGKLPYAAVREERMAFNEAIVPVLMKRIGSGPWTLVHYDNRDNCECATVCSCPMPEGLECPPLAELRVVMTDDVDNADGEMLGIMQACYSFPLPVEWDEMEYKLYLSLAVAISQSYSDPLWSGDATEESLSSTDDS